MCLAALLNDEYSEEALPITSPESPTFGEATAIISEAIGRPLLYQVISDEEARERYSRISGSQEETEAHVALWQGNEQPESYRFVCRIGTDNERWC